LKLWKGAASVVAWLILLSLATALACQAKLSGEGTPLPTAPSVPQRTTRGDIAVRNLSDRIQALERQLLRPQRDLATHARLVDFLLLRTQFLNSFADFARVRELADAAVRQFPDQAKAHLLQARAFSAVHRFAEAEVELAKAAELGADTATQFASIHIAQGRELPAALAVAQQRATTSPTLEHLSLWASAEAALGEFEAADDHYRAALRVYRDVSPFPVAYLMFQRGVMWAELAGAPDRALPLYAEAVQRLPEYVVANVHLAELEAERGQPTAAIQRLQRLVAQTNDPEPLGYLGELLTHANPNDVTGQQLLGRARAGYEELLKQHRAAFLDHAAEFFTGPGADPPRALELATENLALRPTGRAYAVAIEAALATKNRASACDLVNRAQAASRQNKNLHALIERESAHCGNR
jgi:tetratricopeptide (TPR) repeat protein